MNNFWNLVRFEYKKLLFKKSVIISTVLAFIVVIFSCFTMVMGSNSQGNYYSEKMSAYEMMQMDKAYEKKLAGKALDGTLILEASKAYQKIDKNVVTYSNTQGYQKYARPYSSIYTLIAPVYSNGGNRFNVDDFQNLSEEDANHYYTIRETQLRKSLMNNPLWSETAINQVLEMDTAVQKPFILEYKDGYQRFFALSVTTIMVILFLISFILSSIFCGEYNKGTDNLILSSKNGKRSFLYAKIFAAVSISFCITTVFILSTYFTCMGIYGFDGTNAQIQLLLPLLTYDFTFLETTIILIITSLLGSIFHASICLFVSAISKSSILPMSISCILIAAGMFTGIQNILFRCLRYFLPLSMGNFYDITTQLIFDFFGISIPLYQAASIVAIFISILLFVISWKVFQKHQVR